MQKMKRKRGAATTWPRVLLILAAVIAPAGGAWAAGPGWAPRKFVEISVGAGAGTPTDITVRTMAKVLKDEGLVTVPVTTINRPGAGGELGLQALSEHPGDARHIFIEPMNILTNDITGKSRFTYRDFTPLAVLFSQYVAFTVKADSPLKSGMDLVNQLKKDPGSLSIAIGTTLGNSNHIALGLLMKTAGGHLKGLKTVVFSGAAAAKTALLGGHVDVLISPNSGVISELKAGTVRVIGIAAPHRLGGAFAGVPTWKEQGLNVVLATWRSMVGPKNLSRAQVRYWDRTFGRMVKTREWQTYLDHIPAENGYMDSKQTAAFFRQQYGQLRAVLDALGLTKK